jgi:hypothetical protein
MTARPWHLGHHQANPYFAFTDACNAERPVVILASGQACVWYKLTLASKDGDWIIAHDQAACATVLQQLADLGATYRLGAPLDPRWLAAGWSAHFEAVGSGGERLRFDFVSRPPRISIPELERLWDGVYRGGPAVVSPECLIRLKQTMRLKDYPFIGALALRQADHEAQLRWSIEPGHILRLLAQDPALAARLPELRPALACVVADSEALGAAIDAEIRQLRRTDEARIATYVAAIGPWSRRFRDLDLTHLTLAEAHARMQDAADGVLSESVP